MSTLKNLEKNQNEISTEEVKFYQSIFQKQYDKTSNIDFLNTPINRLSENNKKYV